MSMDVAGFDTGGGSQEGWGARGAAHPNPMNDYLTGFYPRKLKDVFKWAEFLRTRSAHVCNVVRSFGEYPITRFIYEEAGNDNEKKRHKEALETHLQLKGFLTQVSGDLWTYGNCFVSVYEPILRELKCTSCGTWENITAADYTFNLDKLQFKMNCRACKLKNSVAEVKDLPLRKPERLKLLLWDPKAIDIEHNPVTGEAVYYYQIPRDTIAKVRAGEKVQINHTPMGMLRAMQDRKTFKFEDDKIFHLKMKGPSGLQAQWGHSPMTAAIGPFMFAATLRKANEAIALDHLTPMRIIHPLAGSAQGDPLTTIPLDEWRTQMERNLRLFRRDPLRIQFSPIPVGVQNVGGEGRAMLTLGELQEAEKAIIMAFGVPMEFVTGGLGQTRGEITLRMIENKLQTHIENLNSLIQWVEKKVAIFMGWGFVKVRLADFKMIDDMDNKQLKMSLFDRQIVSEMTVAEMLNIDLAHERDQRYEDTIANEKVKQKTSIAVQKLQIALSQQAQQGALQAQGGMAYDQQQIIAQADQRVQELIGLDAGSRRSVLDKMKGEDFVMYSVIVQRLEQTQQDQMAQMKAQGGGGETQGVAA